MEVSQGHCVDFGVFADCVAGVVFGYCSHKGPNSTCSVMIWVERMSDSREEEQAGGGDTECPVNIRRQEASSCRAAVWNACLSEHFPAALSDAALLLASVEAENNPQDIGPQVYL